MIAFANITSMGPIRLTLHAATVRQWVVYATGVPRALMFHEDAAKDGRRPVPCFRALGAWLVRYHGPCGLRRWEEVAAVFGYRDGGAIRDDRDVRYFPRYPSPNSAALFIAQRFHQAWNGMELGLIPPDVAYEAFIELQRSAEGKEVKPWNGIRLARASA